MNQSEYNLIARTLVGWYNIYAIDFVQFDGLVNHFADRLEINYPKTFDRDKFMKACGL